MWEYVNVSSQTNYTVSIVRLWWIIFACFCASSCLNVLTELAQTDFCAQRKCLCVFFSSQCDPNEINTIITRDKTMLRKLSTNVWPFTVSGAFGLKNTQLFSRVRQWVVCTQSVQCSCLYGQGKVIAKSVLISSARLSRARDIFLCVCIFYEFHRINRVIVVAIEFIDVSIDIRRNYGVNSICWCNYGVNSIYWCNFLKWILFVG